MGLAASARPAAAAAQERSFAEEVLEILRESGQVTPEQYERLRKKAKAEAEAEAKVQAQAEKQPLASDWSFHWKNGFTLAKGKGDEFKLKFGGRIQNDWGVYAPDGNLKDSLGGNGTGTKFRRARLFFQGRVYRYAFFKAQYDFAAGGAFKDVYLGLEIPKLGALRVGHMKEPFSLEELTSSKYLTFVERSIASVFNPSRNTGLGMNGSLGEQSVNWALGVYRDTDSLGRGFGNQSAYNVTARISGTPLYEDHGARLLHLGVSYSHQFRSDNQLLRYRERPENSFAPRLVDTGAIDAEGVDLINAGAALVQGPFSVQAEGTGSFVNPVSGGAMQFWGTYAQVSYFLTGEHRVYKRSSGAFARISPRRNFDPAEGSWGAFELAARYSYLDLNSRDVRGGRLQDVTAGLNWYLFPNVRVLFDYVFARESSRGAVASGTAHSALARFQIDF